MAVRFIGGGNWSTRRKPWTCRKSLTNFITYLCIETPFKFCEPRNGFTGGYKTASIEGPSPS
jgi:hypothetical protein